MKKLELNLPAIPAKWNQFAGMGREEKAALAKLRNSLEAFQGNLIDV